MLRTKEDIEASVTARILREAENYPGYPELARRHGVDQLPDYPRAIAFGAIGQFRIERFLVGFRERRPVEAARLAAIRAGSQERVQLVLAPYLSEARLTMLLSDLHRLGEAAYRPEDDGRHEAAVRLAIGGW